MNAFFRFFKNTFLAVLVLPCLLSLAAAQASAEPLRVALLLENAAEDNGAATLMKKGLAEASAKADISPSIIVCPPDADQTELFRKACESNDLVLLFEPRLHMILRDNAANYRKVSFGCIDTGVRAPNIMSITFSDEQPAFLAGALSALLLKKGQKLGWLEDEEGPVHDTMLAAFIDGAQVQNPDIRVVRRQTGFAGSASAMLKEFAAQDVGIAAIAAGYATPAALREMQQGAMLAVGTDCSHFDEASSIIPFSVVKRYDKACEELVLAKANGTFAGKQILTYDMGNGGVDCVINPAYKKSKGLPASIERRLSELRHELANGNIKLQDKRIGTLCDCLD